MSTAHWPACCTAPATGAPWAGLQAVCHALAGLAVECLAASVPAALLMPALRPVLVAGRSQRPHSPASSRPPGWQVCRQRDWGACSWRSQQPAAHACCVLNACPCPPACSPGGEAAARAAPDQRRGAADGTPAWASCCRTLRALCLLSGARACCGVQAAALPLLLTVSINELA